MKQSITFFHINKLFGTQDVKLSFDEVENIYIGENGLGKTTILSTIFNTLSGNFLELLKVDFESIKVGFKGGYINEFSKFEVEQLKYLERRRLNVNNKIIDMIQETIKEENLNFLVELSEELSGIALRENEKFLEEIKVISNKLKLPNPIAARHLYELINIKGFEKNNVYQLKVKLKEIIGDLEILYFPTFRRIEEDFTKLKESKSEFSDVYIFENDVEEEERNSYGELIKFGMSDVESTRDRLLEQIRVTSISTFNQMTAILLKQYVNNNIIDNTQITIDLTDLEISLNRVGSEIGEDYKQKIMYMVESKEIFQEENKYLLNFIQNILKSHAQLKSIDDRIEKFVDICNKYLVNKKYVYDPSNITLNIFNQYNNCPIELKSLSSGEKQIISTFSKVYLEHEKDYIILFDEPELSLSISWQQRFISDIVASNNINMLVCVTHSPFIFREDRLFEIAKEILDEIEIVYKSEGEQFANY